MSQNILSLGNVTFESMTKEDILYWEDWEGGFGPRTIFELYNKKGVLKDVKIGRFVDIECPISKPERKPKRTYNKRNKKCLI